MPLSQCNPPLILCTLDMTLIRSVICRGITTSASLSSCLSSPVSPFLLQYEDLKLAEMQTLLQVNTNLEYAKHRGP